MPPWVPRSGGGVTSGLSREPWEPCWHLNFNTRQMQNLFDPPPWPLPPTSEAPLRLQARVPPPPACGFSRVMVTLAWCGAGRPHEGLL